MSGGRGIRGQLFELKWSGRYAVASDPTTGGVTSVMTLNIFTGSSQSMACESSTRVYVSQLFAGFGSLFTINPLTATRQTLLSVASNGDTFIGLASAPSGLLYATIENRNTTAAPYPQVLATVSTINGARTPVGTVQLPQVWDLAFRGTRLLGLASGRQLVQVNTQTGVVTSIRSTSRP